MCTVYLCAMMHLVNMDTCGRLQYNTCTDQHLCYTSDTGVAYNSMGQAVGKPGIFCTIA